MSLLTLPAFLARRKDTPMPETAETSATQTDDNVRMRFLNQGGAIVFVTGSSHYGAEDHHWRCAGCHETDNGIGRWDWEARRQANAHATACRALPAQGA